MTAYRFTSSALTELKQAALHYEEKENGLGGRFLDEIDTTVARILANPHAWHPLSRGPGGVEPTAFHSVSSTRFVPTRF